MEAAGRRSIKTCGRNGRVQPGARLRSDNHEIAGPDAEPARASITLLFDGGGACVAQGNGRRRATRPEAGGHWVSKRRRAQNRFFDTTVAFFGFCCARRAQPRRELTAERRAGSTVTSLSSNALRRERPAQIANDALKPSHHARQRRVGAPRRPRSGGKACFDRAGVDDSGEGRPRGSHRGRRQFDPDTGPTATLGPESRASGGGWRAQVEIVEARGHGGTRGRALAIGSRSRLTTGWEGIDPPKTFGRPISEGLLRWKRWRCRSLPGAALVRSAYRPGARQASHNGRRRKRRQNLSWTFGRGPRGREKNRAIRGARDQARIARTVAGDGRRRRASLMWNRAFLGGGNANDAWTWTDAYQAGGDVAGWRASTNEFAMRQAGRRRFGPDFRGLAR